VSSPRRSDPDASLDAARRIARECLGVRVGLLNRVVTRVYEDALKPLGLTGNQLGMLAMIEIFGEAQPSELGRRLQMEKSTVSRTVERMLRSGWVREHPSTDARRVVLTATPAGRALLRKALPLWANAQAQARQALGDSAVSAVAAVADQFLTSPGGA
jgi:DNA-binding MarR family transcriptional regulator